MDLFVGGVVPQGPDDGAALGCRDGPAAVGVEEGERLLDIGLVSAAIVAAVAVVLILAAAVGLVIDTAIVTLVTLVACKSTDMVIFVTK